MRITVRYSPGWGRRLPEDSGPVCRLAVAGPALERSGLRRDRYEAALDARLRRRDRLVLPAAIRCLRKARAAFGLLIWNSQPHGPSRYHPIVQLRGLRRLGAPGSRPVRG